MENVEGAQMPRYMSAGRTQIGTCVCNLEIAKFTDPIRDVMDIRPPDRGFSRRISAGGTYNFPADFFQFFKTKPDIRMEDILSVENIRQSSSGYLADIQMK